MKNNERKTYFQFISGEIPSMLQIITLPSIFTIFFGNFLLIIAIALITFCLLYIYLENKSKRINKNWSQYNVYSILVILFVINLIIIIVNLGLITNISFSLENLNDRQIRLESN